MGDSFQNGALCESLAIPDCDQSTESTATSLLSKSAMRTDALIAGEELASPVEGIRISRISQTTPLGFILHPGDDHLLIARISNRSETRYDCGKGLRTYETRHGQILVRPAREKSAWWFSRPNQTVILRISEQSLRTAWDNETDNIWVGLTAMETFRQDSLLAQLIERLCAELTRLRSINRAYVRSLLFQLTTDLVRRYSAPLETLLHYAGMPPSRLRKVMIHISENLEKDLSLSTLSLVAGISRYYFCREFTKSMGITPQRYVMQQRIKRAKEMLESSECSITEISELLKFPTPSHFTATFRKFVGVTPTAFRVQSD